MRVLLAFLSFLYIANTISQSRQPVTGSDHCPEDWEKGIVMEKSTVIDRGSVMPKGGIASPPRAPGLLVDSEI